MDKKNTKKLTHRQARAIEFWRDGGFKSKAQALRDAGYEKSVWRNPDKVFGSPVVQAYFMKAGIREGLIFQPLKIGGDGKWGGAYKVVPNENTEEGYELVKIQPEKEPPRPPLRKNGEVEIPSRSTLEVYEEIKRGDVNANPTMGDIF